MACLIARIIALHNPARRAEAQRDQARRGNPPPASDSPTTGNPSAGNVVVGTTYNAKRLMERYVCLVRHSTHPHQTPQRNTHVSNALLQHAGLLPYAQTPLLGFVVDLHKQKSTTNRSTGVVRSGQVFIVQLLSAVDASATNSLHCSLSSAMSHSVILSP